MIRYRGRDARSNAVYAGAEGNRAVYTAGAVGVSVDLVNHTQVGTEAFSTKVAEGRQARAVTGKRDVMLTVPTSTFVLSELNDSNLPCSCLSPRLISMQVFTIDLVPPRELPDPLKIS